MWIINKLKFIFFIFSLFLLNFSFSANFNIQNDLITDTLKLIPQDSPPECSASFKGRLYYNSNDKQIYYCDGTTWQVLGAGGKDTTIGSAIVASSSADTSRADFVCDGTDDQEEIQQAIDYLSNAGGAVYLLEGTYNLSNNILFDDGSSDGIDDSNKALIGTGAGTVLNLNLTPDNVTQSSDVSRIVLSQLRIKYNLPFGGCWFGNISYSLLEKLWLEECEIWIVKSNFNIIAENFFTSLSKPLPLLWFDDAYGGGSSSYSIIHNNIFTTTSSYGAIGIASDSSNNIVIGNIIKDDSDSPYRGIEVSSPCNIIAGNRLFRVREGILGWGTNILSSNVISQLVGSGSFGILSDADVASSNFISDGDIGIIPCENALLVGNMLYNTQNNGINTLCGKGRDNNLISSNYIHTSTGSGYGILITPNILSNAENNYLVGNFIGGSGYSQPINDQGKTTRYTDKIKISLEPGEYTGLENGKTLTPQGATSYLRLEPSSNINLGNPNIARGKTEGDTLIIENAASGNYYVRFKDGQGVELENSILVGGKLDLYPGDILVFVWNGSRWIEIGYSDN